LCFGTFYMQKASDRDPVLLMKFDNNHSTANIVINR
jgi:hypothetical protein